MSALSDFDALSPEWTSLAERSNASVFQTFEWLRTWWKYYGEKNPSAQLKIILVKRSGKLIGVAPLYIDAIRRAGFVRLRRLEFIGTGITDYLDFIIEPGSEHRCIREIVSVLVEQAREYDVIQLIDMPERSQHALLYAELEKHGFQGKHFASEVCPRLRLMETWEETLNTFPSRKAKRMRQVQRRLESDFRVTFDMTLKRDALPRDFNEFLNLHQRRWREDGHSGVFAEEATREFHKEIAERFLEREWLFLAFMSLDGKRVAANYSFAYKNELYHYLSGLEMRGNLLKYSIGRALQIYSISEATRSGLKVYDFLRGPEEYKYYFNCVDEKNYTVLMFPRASSWIENKVKIVLLMDSFHRRATRESLLWKNIIKTSGFWSRPHLEHIKSRTRMNLEHAAKKIRAPEKSLTSRSEDDKVNNGPLGNE